MADLTPINDAGALSADRQSMPDANFPNWVKPEQIAGMLEFICSEKGDAVREPVYKLYNNS